MTRNKDAWIYLALLCVTFAVYSQVRNFEFLNYDDSEYVTHNSHVRAGLTGPSVKWAFESTEAAYWFPLTRLSYLVDEQVHGLDAGWFHLTNVLLHAASTLLLFACLSRMTGALWRSAFVALVFAVHPAHVETVAWVAERKELLSALFWFLTLWIYLIYVERPRVWLYLVMLLLFCCGLMSQALIVTLPLVMLGLDYWPLGRFSSARGGRLASSARQVGDLPYSGGGAGLRPALVTSRQILLEKIPLIGLAVAASAITVVAQRRGGALASLGQVPLLLRIENAAISYVTYLFQFVWPAKLSGVYPYRGDIPGWQFGAAAILLAGITGYAGMETRRRPYLLTGWLWFVLTLAPVSGLFQAGPQPHADRYTYLPFIGIAIAIAWGAVEMFGNSRVLAVAAAAVCVVWLAITWTDLGYWRDSVALFQHAVDVTSDNWIAQNTLGDALVREGKLDEAMAHLNDALRLEPSRVEVRLNLGVALAQRGDNTAAETQYRAALKLDPENPDAEEGLGVVLLDTGRMPEAAAQLEKSVKSRPDEAGGHFQLGRCYASEGKTEQAASEFSEAVRLDPDDPEARFNLGTALGGLGRFREATDQLRVAVRLKPNDASAHLNLGGALASMGLCDQAVPEFQAALRLEPNLTEASAAIEACAERR